MSDEDLVGAIERTPNDDAAFKAYIDHLRSAGDPLIDAKPKARLGPLAAFGASIKVEKWRAVFVDHVRLIADDEKHAMQMLNVLLAHPATRFVRTLELLIIGKRRSYADIDARLADAQRPRTLTKLVLGKPGDHVFSTALLSAFPHIGAAPRKSWDDVAAAIRALRGAGPGFANEPLAIPRGATLPITTAELVRGLAAEIGRKHVLDLYPRLVDDWSLAQLEALSASLITAWTAHGEDASEAWVYDAAARFGGADSARLIGQRIATTSHGRAEHAIDTLARMTCPLATLELFAASTLWTARGELAELALERRAASRQDLRTALDPPDVLSLLAATGRDPQCSADTLVRFRELDARAMEHLMVTGWTAPLEIVRTWFAGNRAKNLVWRTNVTSTPTLFTLEDDHALSHDGRPFEIAPDSPVSLVHVADPDVRDIAPWKMWQYSHPAPFEQLVRTAPPHASLDELARNTVTSIEALRARGYRNGGFKTDDTHEELFYVKAHRHRGKSYSITIAMVGDPIRAPRSLPAVVCFEIARDIAHRV